MRSSAMRLARPALTDRQIARMRYRIGLFQRRGLTEIDAELLADRLADRDYQRDDRRMCIECAHLQRDGGCFAARQGWIEGAAKWMQPIKQLLLRCEMFSWSQPS